MNYMVLQGGVLSALMIGSVLVLAQVLNEKGCIFSVNEWVFCPIVLFRASPRWDNSTKV